MDADGGAGPDAGRTSTRQDREALEQLRAAVRFGPWQLAVLLVCAVGIDVLAIETAVRDGGPWWRWALVALTVPFVVLLARALVRAVRSPRGV
jgi:hypothetical protein